MMHRNLGHGLGILAGRARRNLWAAAKVYLAPRHLLMFTIAGLFSKLIGSRFTGTPGDILTLGPPIGIFAWVGTVAMEAAVDASMGKVKQGR